MWKLKSTKKEHWDHFLFVDEECVVGRKDSTLLISNDPSVSRKHATLFVKHPEENIGNASKASSLFLRDEGSKYGTYKNGTRITNEEQLLDGDIVKFGQFDSEFRIHYEPVIVTTSCLDVLSKSNLKKNIHKLGGHIVSEWQPSCTHLVMSSVKVTVKALCCLVSLKSIVLPEYFEELQKKLKSSASVLPPNQFLPPIGESLIDKDVVSFDVNRERKNIFKNKVFFFMDNKQFKKLHLGIVTGGGSASILPEDKFDTEMLLQDNVCFIEPMKGQLVTEKSKNLLNDIKNSLQKRNLRMIPESDIGLAVAYASTEKFCNPSFNVGSVVLGSQRIPSQSLTEREVYVADTQERTERPKPSIRKFLATTSDNEPKSKKQKTEAADSLNLATFRDDPEDVFEIPLSAQVKQELDDIFDITMKNIEESAQNEEELGATLPVELDPEVEVNHVEPDPVFEPVNRKKSSPKKKEERMPKIENKKEERKKPKIGNNAWEITNVNGNGISSVFMNEEENLPRNLMKVQFVSLVVRRPAASSETQCINSNVKNFKKFKKVLPLKVQSLPRIIGAHELAPYDKDAAKFANENWDDEPEVVNTAKPVQGAFDWGSQNW